MRLSLEDRNKEGMAPLLNTNSASNAKYTVQKLQEKGLNAKYEELPPSDNVFSTFDPHVVWVFPKDVRKGREIIVEYCATWSLPSGDLIFSNDEFKGRPLPDDFG